MSEPDASKGVARAPTQVRPGEVTRRIVRQQVAVTVVIALALLAAYGTTVAVSAFVGGAIGFVTNWVYARTMAVPPGSDPKVYLSAHFKAEGFKLALTCVLFAATFILFRGVAALPLFLTYGATLLVFWVALLTS